MDRIYAKAQKEVLRRWRTKLLAAIQEAQNTAENENREATVDEIRKCVDDLLQETHKKFLSQNADSPGWDFSTQKAERILIEDSIIRIRPFSNEDERFYAAVREQYSVFNKGFSEDDLVAYYRPDSQQNSSFFCIIERVHDGIRLGYLSLKDTSRDIWEISIELDREFCGQGYGPRAITLFLGKIRELTGKSQFQFLVEVDNLLCQGCMRKINAELVGICRFSFDSEEEERLFEDKNLDLITPHMKMLAEKLNVPPRKMLSQVLDYRITL